jgi:hypothetical protein
MPEPAWPVSFIHILIWISLSLTGGHQQQTNCHADGQPTSQNSGF